MNESQARAVLLLQSFETAAEGPLWTADDRAWATRAAQQSLGDGAAPAREAFIAERARLALQRLAPRDAGVRRLLAYRAGSPLWAAAALGGGLLLGLAADGLVAGAYFNLLSPLFWGLLGWNLVLYVAMAVAALGRRGPGPLQRAAAALLQRGSRGAGRAGPRADFAARWARVSLPLALARASLLLHLLAGGIALGLIAGLWLRGLVFDYRAGWATTLLQPETVRTALALLLAPAHAVTGIAPPDAATFDALRVLPGRPASASAAPWIVLMGTQLALFVVLPRAVLAAAAAWRAHRLARRFELPLTGPYFERLQPPAGGRGLWVLPHVQAPAPQAVLNLRALLVRVWGEAVPLQVAPALPYGDEEQPPPVPAGMRPLVLVDLNATPEPDVHGRLLAAVAAQGGMPLLLADASAFVQRFGAGPRCDERTAAWRTLARDHGAGFVALRLEAPDPATDEPALRAAAESLT